MKSSILITSYNKGKYLEQCILSCLNQNTINEGEILVLDNYSNDNSDQILKKFENKIKIYKKKKISEFPAINQIDLIKEGIEISKGDTIFLLDGDDYFLENKLSAVNNLFKKNTNLDVVFDLPLKKRNDKFSKFLLKKKFNNSVWPTIINTSSIAIKKEFILEILNKKLFNDFNLLEIDFRINVYSRNIKKNYIIAKDAYTVYRQLDESIMGNIKKYSSKWWQKRKQAHEFMKIMYLNNGLEYHNKLDFLLTNFINKFIKTK